MSKLILVILIGACAVASGVPMASAAQDAARGVRFDSPGVLDVSDRDLKIALSSDVPIVVLSAADAEAIATAPALDENAATLSFSDDEFRCKPASHDCSRSAERERIAASQGAAMRNGGTLTITTGASTSTVFKDWKMAESKSADGDGETHWYLGAMRGSGYQRVEVQFEHDAPGDFLINATNGKMLFVHNGSDIAALSPDGAALLTFDPLNAPLAIRVVALDKNGPAIVIACQGHGDDRTKVEFKGWRDAQGANFALVARAERSRLAHATAFRLQRVNGRWQLAAAAADALHSTGLSCRQAD